MPIKKGVYDQLVTDRIRQALDKLEGHFQYELDELEEADCPDYISRHLARQIKSALSGLPAKDRREKQIELANALLAFTKRDSAESESADLVENPGKLLRSIYSQPVPPKRPSTPLSRNSLLMNALDEPRLGFELDQEMHTADRVLMLVSFIQWRGWQRLKPAFLELAKEKKPIRILTTTYIGATDLRALEALTALPNVELKISLDGRRRRLHAKAWLFDRLNGFSSAYVGSANLSGPALEDGIEWTVKLSEIDSPHIVERFRGAFDTLWQDEEFELFEAGDEVFRDRVRRALDSARNTGAQVASMAPMFFDLKPHAFQQATLDQLEAERLDRGHFRNLVVAPTGTGKTMVAAFDYARQIGSNGLRPKLLFLAHREELLKQARTAFRHVLRDESFGDLLGGGEEPLSYDHLFSTVQSFQSRALLERMTPKSLGLCRTR